MMTARELLNFVLRYESALRTSPAELLGKMPDEQLKGAVLMTASLLSELKREAIRRGLWDQLKGCPVGQSL